MVNISNVINISLALEGQAAQPANPNDCCVITSQVGVVSSATRTKSYADYASVVTDWGSVSEVTAAAAVFFGTNPNPVSVGGRFIVGFWRKAEEAVGATAATLVSGVHSDEAALLEVLQGITFGTLTITTDGTEKAATGINLSTKTTMAEVAAAIDTALTSSPTDLQTVVWDDRLGQMVITSKTTGAPSTITLATGTVAVALKLSAGSGAVATQGVASGTLALETQVAAATACLADRAFRGLTFIEALSDTPAMGAWAQANSVLVYEAFSGAAELVIATSKAWATKLAGYTYFRCLYSAASNRNLAVSYMARVHTVDFAGERTASTMHLKTLAVAAEDYTQAQIDTCKSLGLDIYTTIKDVPVLLTSGANDFTDNIYNLMYYQEQLTVDLFNALKTSTTKIPQTQAGVDTLLDACEKTTRQFVRAGVFAPGTWTSSAFFGDRETFDRNIEENGFYWLAGSLADQSAADRQARKSPTLQGAVKNAGAIHSVGIIVNVNL